MPTTFTNLKNNCATVLNTSIDGAVTTVVAVAGGGAIFPATPFYLSCEYEVMKCTGRSADVLTVVRGQDGTTAAAHTAGAIIEQRNNAAMWTDISTAVTNIENGTTPVPLNVPDGSITDVKLAADVPQPNLLQNGGFEIWPYGSGPWTANGPVADSWELSIAAGAAASITRDTANVDTGSQYCLAMVTSGAVSAGAEVIVSQTPLLIANAPKALGLTGRTVTFSCRIKTATASGVRIALADTTATPIAYSSYHTGGSVYQTLSITFTVGAAATAFYVQIRTSLALTAYFDNASLVFGSGAANYLPAISFPDALPNARLAADVARDNLLVNGGLEIWQRGNGPVSTNAVFSADRWIHYNGTASTTTVSRDTTSSDKGGACAAITHTFGSGASTFCQDFRSAEILQFRNRVVSLSIRVLASIAGAVAAYIYDDINGYRIGAFHTGDGTYQTLTVTAVISPSINTIVQVGVRLEKTVNCFVDAACLVFGLAPAEYLPMHPADDLARCQRYYEVHGGAAGASFVHGLYGSAGAAVQVTHVFAVSKGAVPTLTRNGTWATTNLGSQPVLGDPSGASYSFVMSIGAQGMGQAYSGGPSASITAEANP
jgi:hypothetical protein